MALAPTALAVVVAAFAVTEAGRADNVVLGFLAVVLAILGGGLGLAGGVLRDGTHQRNGLVLAALGYFQHALLLGLLDPLEAYGVAVLVLVGTSMAPAGWRYLQILAAPGRRPSSDRVAANLRAYAVRMAAAGLLTYLASAAVLNLALTTSVGFVDPVPAFLLGLAILLIVLLLATTRGPAESSGRA